MRDTVIALEGEYRRYKALAEGAIAQLGDEELSRDDSTGGNSVAVIVWHISGNLASRFSDFLSTDGEKPWRHRDEEFSRRTVTKSELLQKWNAGWETLLGTLAVLRDEDLSRSVTIRGVPFRVDEALYRSLAHTTYHIGQIVFLAKSLRGDRWKWLTIPPGQSEAYNQNPILDKAAAHAAVLRQDPQGHAPGH